MITKKSTVVGVGDNKTDFPDVIASDDMTRYWVVNQGKTFDDEFNGGYLWAPITNKIGRRSPFYTNVTKVKSGDVIFSLVKGTIPAIGICEDEFTDCKNPLTAHKENWINDGWKIGVKFTKLDVPIEVKPHMARIMPLLPKECSPINKAGIAQQGGYLSGISEELASLLRELSGSNFDEVVVGEDAIEDGIRGRTDISTTEKKQLTTSRRGQGQYKKNVYENEKACRVTGLDDPRFLIASHIKPWAKSSDAEKLDGCNGLLLTPSVDKLFDRGDISFTDSGDILCSPSIPVATLQLLGVDIRKNVGRFNKRQCEYMAYHRDNVFSRRT